MNNDEMKAKIEKMLNDGSATTIGQAMTTLPNIQLNLNPLTIAALHKAVHAGLTDLRDIATETAIHAKLADREDDEHVTDQIEGIDALYQELIKLTTFLDQLVFDADGNPDVTYDNTGDVNTKGIETIRRAEKYAMEQIGLSKSTKPNLSVVPGGGSKLH